TYVQHISGVVRHLAPPGACLWKYAPPRTEQPSTATNTTSRVPNTPSVVCVYKKRANESLSLSVVLSSRDHHRIASKVSTTGHVTSSVNNINTRKSSRFRTQYLCVPFVRCAD